MIRFIFLSLSVFLLLGCTQNKNGTNLPTPSKQENVRKIYSKNVNDSFFVTVNLPNEYDASKKNIYPVVYILDANLYFDIYSSIVNKYSEVGLIPSTILVGIGYKDFQTMDSLRNRDYTYPDAMPEYEMTVSGKANNFLAFIKTELIPLIDKEYHVDSSKQILAGHSLGGYFCLYAAEQCILSNNNLFYGYIAASPSIDYDNCYLINEIKTISLQAQQGKKVKLYIGFGDEEEDEEDANRKYSKALNQLLTLVSEKQADNVILKSAMFSKLEHMDTQIPTFIKGLRWLLPSEN